MINLNEEQYENKNVKIFNGGEAGQVKGVTLTVSKKASTDKENAPDYKVIVTDVSGAEINKAFYKGFTDWKDSRLTFFVKEMKHLIGVVGVEAPKEIASYDALLELAMKTVATNAKGKKFNVAVSYGTLDRPSKYLGINSCFAIGDATSTPYIGKNPQMTRVEPDEIIVTGEQGSEDTGGDDLPWGN